MSLAKIAFLGTGLMGLPMATNLIRAGYSLNVWNRTASKAQPLAALGASIKANPAEAVADAKIVICMLENGSIVDSVLFQQAVVDNCAEGTLIIDMSSISPELTKQHAKQLSQLNINYLDAPVSGGTVGAEQATLSIMVGGEKAIYEQALPVFNSLGKATIYIGPAGSGQLAKCANQAIVGITIGAVSEALLLAAEGGADPVAVREALLGGFAQSRILDLHGQRMIDRNFMPGATARVQLKDLRTILDTARARDLTLPLSQRVYDEYLNLTAQGLENVDHSGLMLQLENLNSVRLGDAETKAPAAVEKN